MRPEAQATLGYYPTPPNVIDAISRHLTAQCPDPKEAATYHDRRGATIVIDPCCGTGAAANQLARAIASLVEADCGKPHRHFAYGVEIHDERAMAARQILRRCFISPIQAVDLPSNSFQVALVNPPYDETPSTTATTRRLESLFLQRTTPSLAPHGILVYIVPQRQLAIDADYIAVNYCDVRVFRFPDLQFPTFRQAVLIARRNQLLHRDLSPDQGIRQYLIDQANAGMDAVPVDTIPTNNAELTSVTIPHWLYAGNLPEIRKNADTDENIRMYLRQSEAYRHPAIIAHTKPKPPTDLYFKPLEPLRRGHLCVLAANGQFDATPLHDPDGVMPPIVIKGSIRRDNQVVHADADETVEQDVFTTSLNVMNLLTGDIEHIGVDADALQQFLVDNQPRLELALTQRHQPRIDPTDARYAPVRQRIAQLARRPIGKQAPSCVTAAVAIRDLEELFLVGQPGIGKTFLTIAACRGAEFSRMLVITPSHNPETWVREIVATWPAAKIRIVTSIGNPRFPDVSTFDLKLASTDLETIRQTPASPDEPVWAIMKRDTAKRTYPFSVFTRPVSGNPTAHDGAVSRLYRTDHSIASVPANDHTLHQTCPFCLRNLDDDIKTLQHRDARCPHCFQHLAAPNCRTPADRKVPWTDYIARHMPTWADVFIMDEVHQYKNRDSAQGEVARRLAQASRRVMALTGTLIGGKATDAFYLLCGVSKRFRRKFGYQEHQLFLSLYGREERTFRTTSPNPDNVRTGTRTTRRSSRTKTREINGFKPSLMNHFWENTIFTRIPDIAPSVPEPTITAHLVQLDDTPLTDASGDITSHQEAYQHLAATLQAYHDDNDTVHSFTLQSRMQQELLTFPENAWQTTKPAGVHNEVIATIPALPKDRIYPKEQLLIELLKEQKHLGNKCLVYCTHTKTRDVTKRLAEILSKAGINAMPLPQMEADRRLSWLETASLKADAIICHPKSVETGLNLLQFPTIIWFELDYSLYLIEQASARSHRINQTIPVSIHFLAYANTLQERALRIIAAKADTGRLIYGELSATGLSAFNPEADDIRSTMARELFESDPSPEHAHQDINTLFNQRRDLNASLHHQSRTWLNFADINLPEFDEPVPEPATPPTPEPLSETPNIPAPPTPAPTKRRKRSPAPSTQVQPTLF